MAKSHPPNLAPKSNADVHLTFAKNDTKSAQDFAKSSIEKQRYDKKTMIKIRY